jgi:hypothetical protein
VSQRENELPRFVEQDTKHQTIGNNGELRHAHFGALDSLDIGREAAEFAVFQFSITFAPYKWKRYGDLRVLFGEPKSFPTRALRLPVDAKQAPTPQNSQQVEELPFS